MKKECVQTVTLPSLQQAIKILAILARKLDVDGITEEVLALEMAIQLMEAANAAR